MHADVVGQSLIVAGNPDPGAGSLRIGYARRQGGTAQQDGRGASDDTGGYLGYYVPQNLSRITLAVYFSITGAANFCWLKRREPSPSRV